MLCKSTPTPADLHVRVLRAAGKLFLENGFRVSMGEVAVQAKVSRQTVYAHFANKEALFRAAVGELMQPLHVHLQSRSSAGQNLATTLLLFARAHQAYFFQTPQIALGRMLIAEAPRFPMAARHLFRLALGDLQHLLAERMQQAMDAGEIRQDDPEVAAELFLSMLKGLESDRRLFGVAGRSRKAQEAWGQHAVTVFLKAYAPRLPAAAAFISPDLVLMEST